MRILRTNDDKSETTIKIFRYCAILNRRTLASVGIIPRGADSGGRAVQTYVPESEEFWDVLLLRESEGRIGNDRIQFP